MATLMSFTSCLHELNQSNAAGICRLLQEKYGTEFHVLSIGDRLSSPGASRVTAYCCPADNHRIVFEAVMNVHNELVSDNFIERVIDVQAEEDIEKRLKKYGIMASVNADVYPVSASVDYQSADFIQLLRSTSGVSVSLTTVVCETKDLKKLYEVLAAVFKDYYKENKSVILGTTVWHIRQEQYDGCVKEMRSKPFPSKTVFEQCSPIGNVTVLCINGKPDIDFREFRDSLVK